ncbi:MAG TPA: type IV toxin-antitoxin system AbiEi family antitoxin domain-containing protein [Streptosporangiales bacterium]
MNRQLAGLAEPRFGAFTTDQARACGYSYDAIKQMLRSGRWHRLRRGAYIDRVTFDGLDRLGRHRALIGAVSLSYADRVAISHESAAVLHGIALWDRDLSRVHVTRLDDGAPRIERDVHHHAGELPPAHVVLRDDGLLVSSPHRTLLEVACTSTLEQALVTADAGLHSGLVRHAEFRELVDACRSWPGARNAGAVVSLADGRAESVGETRTRLAMRDAGLPTPELQVEIHDRFGSLVGRVDFLFPEQNTIVEFDGRVKYDGTCREPSAKVLYEEKLREDQLRELGYEVVRIVWADLENPAHVIARVRRAFARAEARRAALRAATFTR